MFDNCNPMKVTAVTGGGAAYFSGSNSVYGKLILRNKNLAAITASTSSEKTFHKSLELGCRDFFLFRHKSSWRTNPSQRCRMRSVLCVVQSGSPTAAWDPEEWHPFWTILQLMIYILCSCLLSVQGVLYPLCSTSDFHAGNHSLCPATDL